MARILEDWIESYMKYTSHTEPPTLYRKWVAVSTIASVLQRKCLLPWGSELFYPNLYIVLVGPPAARKGTAMRPGRELLSKLGVTMAADESSRQRLIRTLQQTADAHQTKEGRLNYHCSLTIISSELTVFLGYDNKDLVTMLCKWYDCEDRFVYETVSRDREEVPNVWVNLLGATTPGLLQASLPAAAISSGFTSRIIFVYAEDKAKVVTKPTLDPDIEPMLLNDLGEIRLMNGRFYTTSGFDELYEHWRNKAESMPVFKDTRLDYYVQRRPAHLFKTTMIISAARRDALELTEHDLMDAITMLEEVEEPMPHVFRGVGTNPLAGVQLQVMAVLNKRNSIPLKELADIFFSDLSRSQLGEVISTMESMGFCAFDAANRCVTRTK